MKPQHPSSMGNSFVIQPFLTHCTRISSYFSNLRWYAQSKLSFMCLYLYIYFLSLYIYTERDRDWKRETETGTGTERETLCYLYKETLIFLFIVGAFSQKQLIFGRVSWGFRIHWMPLCAGGYLPKRFFWI